MTDEQLAAAIDALAEAEQLEILIARLIREAFTPKGGKT